MVYRIVGSDELYHYGVKGMKWGVRHDKERVGGLTQKQYSKYYTNGRLNAKGQKVKSRARYNQKDGGLVGAVANTLIRRYTIIGTKSIIDTLHQSGNITITAMHAKGVSYGKRKAVAGAYIAAMGAVKMYELAPIAKTVYSETMYKYNSTYKDKTDRLADLSYYEKTQRKKK